MGIMDKYKSRRVAATSLRVGMVTYNGGQIESVYRDGNVMRGKFVCGMNLYYRVGDRVTVYPGLAR